MTSLLDTDVERELRSGVAAMLAAQSPPEQVLARCESGAAYDARLWRTLAVEMGLVGLAVPDRYGGAGASLREAAVVVEELGRVVAPVPYLGSAVVATTVLCALDDGPLLTELATGEQVVALAVPFATSPGGWSPTVGVHDGRLTGEVTTVADALGAGTLLVPTAAGLYAVAAGDVERRPVVSLDLTRPLCDLVLAGAPGRWLGEAPAAVAAGLTAGAALLGSEQLGVAQWCLDSTVEYVRSRHQFGRPVGSFQAVKHRLADVWVELAQARAVARYAAACLASGGPDPDTPVTGLEAAAEEAAAEEAAVAAALAQAYCGPVAVHAAQECIQLHGGIGFTWEHPAHLYLKRATSTAIAFGSADQHRTALATLVDL